MVGVFLSGLDSVYESAKNQMLTSPSIPPIDEAYSRLSRIPIPAATVPDTTSAMLATRGRGVSFFARGRGGRGRGPPTSRPVCQFCHRIGHTADKCWQKHGRPAFAHQTASTESPEQPKAQHTAPSSELRVDDLLSQLRSLIGDRPQHAPDPTTSTVTTAASASSSGNYEMWAMQVKRTLIAHDKEHLILEPEPVQKVGKYTTWFKDNSLVMVWIVGTLSQDIANEVLHKESAKDMWDSLAATYSQARNETRIMQLHHDIHQMRQDGRPLHTYYSSLKSMFERLNSYFPACKCEQQKAYRDMLMQLFLIPLLLCLLLVAEVGHSLLEEEEAVVVVLRLRALYVSFVIALVTLWISVGRNMVVLPKAQHTAPSSELRVDDLLSQLRSLIGDRPQHAPDPTTSTVTTAASASSSGMYSACTVCPATDTTDWLIDSGASTHLCGDKAQFTSYENITSMLMLLMTLICPLLKEKANAVALYILSLDPKATSVTLNDNNEVYDTWLHAEILRQGAEMLTEHKEQVVNEPETLVSSSLSSTTSSDSMPSSSQPNEPPIHNRFSGMVYYRRSVSTAVPRQSQRVRHPIDRDHALDPKDPNPPPSSFGSSPKKARNQHN
ncbi:hypothetical protein EJ110_NYTH45761 [Nymphaea thermarum]|nr:hypothetical protein EJ110_NYTH45761 [Nymphaea thermarum]